MLYDVEVTLTNEKVVKITRDLKSENVSSEIDVILDTEKAFSKWEKVGWQKSGSVVKITVEEHE